MNGAKKDIAFQLPVETKLCEWVASRWGGLIEPKRPGRVKTHDAVIYRPYRIEFKCDYKAEETGNLFLETFNPYRKEPSGLTATRADWWVIYVPSKATIFVFNPKKMLACIEKHDEWRLKTVAGDNNSNGYLVPIKDAADMPFVYVYGGIML